MPNEMLNEKDIQNLFKDLLLQEDLDGERKILQESGLNIDEKSLEDFHKKKVIANFAYIDAIFRSCTNSQGVHIKTQKDVKIKAYKLSNSGK